MSEENLPYDYANSSLHLLYLSFGFSTFRDSHVVQKTAVWSCYSIVSEKQIVIWCLFGCSQSNLAIVLHRNNFHWSEKKVVWKIKVFH